MKVKFSNLLNALSECGTEDKYYYDQNTEDLFLISEEDFEISRELSCYEDDFLLELEMEKYDDEQRERISLAGDILNENEIDLIFFADDKTVNELEIMIGFANNLNEGPVKEETLNVLKEEKNITKFKEILSRYDLEGKWEAFKEMELKKIAFSFCADNNITIIAQ